MPAFSIPEQAKLVECLAPAADAAGRTGDYVSLKGYTKAYILVHITQGNAATVALTPKQATDVSGSGVKVIGAVARIWADLDTATSDALVRAADAANYTTDVAVKNKIVVFEIDAASLDVNNGFDVLGFTTGASNVANITQAHYLLVGARYPQVTPPTAITD